MQKWDKSHLYLYHLYPYLLHVPNRKPQFQQNSAINLPHTDAIWKWSNLNNKWYVIVLACFQKTYISDQWCWIHEWAHCNSSSREAFQYHMFRAAFFTVFIFESHVQATPLFRTLHTSIKLFNNRWPGLHWQNAWINVSPSIRPNKCINILWLDTWNWLCVVAALRRAH